MTTRQLTPPEAWLDGLSKSILPYMTPQLCLIAAFLIAAIFYVCKAVVTKKLPSGDDCIRVSLTSVTLLTAIVAIVGLLLPTPPAPPQLNENVLRTVGLSAGVALLSYSIKTLVQLFTGRK